MKKTTAFLTEYPFWIFVIFLLAAYLPVFLPFFHIKNDLITQNLPTRFVISESLYSGYFPWWNPYINFGNPQYGDMNGGYWNPFLWLIARTVGYSIWSITLEEMFYVLIGGYGIYLLCRQLGISKFTAIITGLSYMSSGYILGHLQHFCWITGTAFFPFVLLYFFRVHKDPILKNFLLGGACTMLFLSSTHPGLVIGAIYFFLFLLIGIYCFRNIPIYHDRFWSVNAIFLIVTILLSLVVLTSNIDVLQHISRGNKVPIAEALATPTPLSSYLSLLFPLVVQNAAFSDSDIAMRNTWIGIYALIGLFFFFRYSTKKIGIYTIFVLFFFIFLSAGSWFKPIAWHWLPLTGYVRLSGEFSYFAALILLLAAAIGIDRYLALRQAAPSLPLRRLITTQHLILLILLTLFLSVIIILIQHDSVLYTRLSPGDWKQSIKALLDGFTCWDLLFLQSLILIATLAGLKLAGPSTSKITLILAANLILTCWAILPYTGLGMASKTSRQQLISSEPKGIHAQELIPLKNTTFIDTAYSKDLVMLGSYTKKIGYPKQDAYPIILNSAAGYFSDTALVRFIRQQSWLFLSRDTTPGTNTRFDSSILHIDAFGPGRLDLTVSNPGYPFLTFLQNDYPYWEVRVNGHPVKHFTGFHSFITVPVSPAGIQHVEFIFDPRPIRIALWINIGLLALAAGLLVPPKTRKWRPFNRDRHSALS